MNDPRTEMTESLSEFIKTSIQASVMSQEATTRLEYLERQVDRRFTNLEVEMKNVTSHLSNLVREVSTVNDLLREDKEDARRQRDLMQKHQREQDDRWYRYIEISVKEIWEIVKKPLALLVAAFIGWWVSTHLTLRDTEGHVAPVNMRGSFIEESSGKP